MKLFVALAVLIAASEASPATGTVLDVLTANGLTTALDSYTKNGLADVLKGPGPITIFVPTEMAFKKFMSSQPATFKSLNDNPASFKRLLSDRISSSAAPAALTNDQSIKTLNGNTVRINKYMNDGKEIFTVDGCPIIMPGTAASNGMVYMISKITMPDNSLNVTDVIQKDKRFTKLFSLLQTTGLTDTLKSVGPFTLFAPTDDAFKTLPEADVRKLMASPADLKNLLLGHVLPTATYSSGLMTKDFMTANTRPVRVTVDETGVTVGGAKVIDADIPADNGVIHVVDRVIKV